VGTHIGYYTILSTRLVGPRGKVIAVEPNPSTLLRLRKNIQLNHAPNVVVEDVACTDKETTLQVYQAGFWNTGMSSLSRENARRGRDGKQIVSVTVRGRPLDAIIEELDLRRLDLVKIDVEGAEVQVLRGMKRILATFRPTVIIEMAAPQLENMGTTIEELRSSFRESGYIVGRDLDGVNYEWIPDPTLFSAPNHIP